MSSSPSAAPSAPSEAEVADRSQAVRDLLAHPELVSVVYQPVVDLRRAAVVGYEVLARLPGADGPRGWFDAAHAGGLGVDLELAVVRQALARLPNVPGHCFLSVNVSVRAVCDPRLLEEVTGAGDRAALLLLEISESLGVSDLPRLEAALAPLRRFGVRLAVDDASAGYAGLSKVSGLRPDVVKLDRRLVVGAHADPVKRSLADLVRARADVQGATVVAVGVEDADDLRAFCQAGVRFAQGFLLAEPAPVMADLGGRSRQVLAEATEGLVEDVAPLVRRPDHVRLLDGEHSWRADALADGGDAVAAVPVQGRRAARRAARPQNEVVVVVVDDSEAPVALVLGSGDDQRTVDVSLTVTPDVSVVEAARRAVSRDLAQRYDPVVVVDDAGRLVGMFGITELVQHLCAQMDD